MSAMSRHVKSSKAKRITARRCVSGSLASAGSISWFASDATRFGQPFFRRRQAAFLRTLKIQSLKFVPSGMNLSKQFANGLVGELGRVTKLLGNAHRSAGFAVLKSATVPSILIEIGYLSNQTEERLLRSKKHRIGVSQAIGAAIEAYFERQTSLNRT